MENSSKTPGQVPGDLVTCDPLKPLFAVGDAVIARGRVGRVCVITSLPLHNMTGGLNGEPAYRYKYDSVALTYGLEYALGQQTMESTAELFESAQSRRARCLSASKPSR